MAAIYEVDFLGFSYGFRPGRSQHHALDAVYMAITTRKVNWVLDADIKRFFDTIQHDWMMTFLEHRIADPRLLRIVERTLKCGVVDEGRKTKTDAGTPQGAVLSPSLANIYLHYALDLWVWQWRRRHARGEMYAVRYADDSLYCFQYLDDGKRFQRALEQRLSKFGLALNLHRPVAEIGRWLKKVFSGYLNYYAVLGNYVAMNAFRTEICKAWYKTLRRRSQKGGRLPWYKFQKLVKLFVPTVRVVHPYPVYRFGG